MQSLGHSVWLEGNITSRRTFPCGFAGNMTALRLGRYFPKNFSSVQKYKEIFH
jgi:hypothetical protein